MGKKNRVKCRKTSKIIISRISYVANHYELQKSKEIFFEQLKSVYSKNLKQFQELNQTRIDSNAMTNLRCSPSLKNYLTGHESYIRDPSNEYFHIFYIQVNRFLNSLVLTLRETYNNHPTLLKLSLTDAYNILGVVCKDVNNIAANLRNGVDMNCEAISLVLFREKMIKDNILKKYISEYTENYEEETNYSCDLNKSLNNELIDDNNKKKKKKKSKL